MRHHTHRYIYMVVSLVSVYVCVCNSSALHSCCVRHTEDREDTNKKEAKYEGSSYVISKVKI